MKYMPQFRIGEKPYRPELRADDNDLFVVYAIKKGYRPLTAYAFASTHKRAIERVQEGVAALLKAETSKASPSEQNLGRLQSINSSKWEAHPIDRRDILTASQVWASNSGEQVYLTA